MSKKFPDSPAKPELICWGCDKYCPADNLACGNGSDRTQHPIEIFGSDWMKWGLGSGDNLPDATPGKSGPG